MGSLKPSVRVRSVVAPSNGPYSNGDDPVVHAAPASNGYIDHLHEELAVFERDEFDAQAYVQFKCQSMSEKVFCQSCDSNVEILTS